MKLFSILTMPRWQIRINLKLSSGNEKKKKTGKKLKEEDANLKSETVQCSLKEYVSREVHYHSSS